jgi:SAM-dependent methyltransferase
VIHRPQLLADVQTVLRRLEADLLERSEEMAPVTEVLRGEHQRARTAERTAQSYDEWRSDYITQMAAAWVLSCVFVRFLEDNRLIDPPRVAGPGERLARARDEHEIYFRAHPTETDREYLLHIFDELARLPGAKDIFGAHNPIHELPTWLSGDAAGALLTFFQRIDANSGALVHDFTDLDWNTRFLGDLYQDLSEAARKKYALLQTPEFVEEFILDRTLDPAIEEFGLEGLRMLDPTCGSGHFLLGAFQRILDRWLRTEPGTGKRELVQRALDAVYGVDVNPYAVAIARFRLLVAGLQASDIIRLREVPGFRINVTAGDSLLHGRRFSELHLKGETVDLRRVGGSEHVYRAEDLAELNRILGQHYHVVVGNPPYITVKDSALNQAYRNRFSTCHQKYSLAVPFTERFFELAIYGYDSKPAGYVGLITANSFMKREFGKKLIEEFLPRIDLTHVIDTSGAYIPGHGTPTVILLGRCRAPISCEVRAVLGIRGEPSTPEKPAQGLVWRSIVEHLDQSGSQNEFVSITDIVRDIFSKHPWSIGGGGAVELKQDLESCTSGTLSDMIESIGFMAITGEDNVYVAPHHILKKHKLPHRTFGIGEAIRDWQSDFLDSAIFVYTDSSTSTLPAISLDNSQNLDRFFWTYRTVLCSRKMFGKNPDELGLKWFEYIYFLRERFLAPLSIVFAFVATHNHFVLDRGGKVFNRSAPVIKLPSHATEEDHLALLGLLNSSTACFWMKQVFHNKGSTVDEKGARQTTVAFENFYEFTGTGLQRFPVTSEKPLDLAVRLDHLGQEWQKQLPSQLAARFPLPRTLLDAQKDKAASLLGSMIALQEELDWRCYILYGITDQDLCYRDATGQRLEPPTIALGQRAFEIVLARKVVVGELETTWFERHGSTPITEIPAEWPEDYRRLVERRLEMIETNSNIALIEQPEYKRRWNTEPWEPRLEQVLRSWLLDRLEGYFDFNGRMNDTEPPTAKINMALISTSQLADVARQDTAFMKVGELYRNDPAFDVHRLVAELVEAESISLLPVLRYKDSGLRKRKEWEQTWDLQRQEDAINARTELSKDKPEYLTDLQAQALKRREIGDIPVPPKYTSGDFVSSTCWRLRGKLDVPKERWVSFPHCEGADGSLVIVWAGYDHLQLARAISAYYVDIQERLGGRDDPRLVPLLSCLIELLPWLKQWHNDVDPEFGMHMGDYFEGFIQEEARQMGKTLDQITAWEPPKKTARRRRTTTS